ncbi:hypothetical protein [Methylobacterium flocculans]|uniref:hypothetical protein n=1 Tax=Methylobacterium flocculans TaxID=2984843 RepID=UPI0021F35B62|nr:hypothetical protein [Methylobacterium sp. FF17]
MCVPDLHATADRIQAAWQMGRSCRLVARGFRARVIWAARLVDAGMLHPEAAMRIAAEAESLALAFAPLPMPQR